MQDIKSIGLALFLLIASCNILHCSVLEVKLDSLTTDKQISSLQSNEQYTISISASSEDMNWTAIRKWYYKNSDTTLVFNRKSFQKPEVILYKKSQLTFMNQNLLLAFGNGSAEFHNLKLKTKIEFKNVIQVSALKMKGKHILFAVLHEEGFLEIVNFEGKSINQISDVKSLQTADNVGFIINYKKYERFYVVKINQSEIKILFTSDSEIQKVLITDDQKFALVDDVFIKSEKSKLTNEEISTKALNIIHLKTGKISKLLVESSEIIDDYELSPIGNGGSYLLLLKKIVQPDNAMLEIWRGNESNTRTLYKVRVLKKYFIWKSENNELDSLDSDPREIFVAFTNSQFLLKYHPDANHNYTYLHPTITMRLYDISRKQELSLGEYSGVDQGTPETIYSRDGKFIIASPDHKNWILYNLETKSRTAIKGENLKFPIFTEKGDFIYFGSNTGLWKYQIQTQKMSLLFSENGIMMSILNGEVKRQFNDYYFASRWIDTENPILFKRYDVENSKTGYSILQSGKTMNLIPMTGNRIKDLTWNSNLKNVYFLEENYNLPTEVYEQKIGYQKNVIFQSNRRDIVAEKLYKEVIEYKGKKGIPLKGTLFYPANFDPTKQYPMVVKIYKMQRSYGNEYMVKGDASYVAYDKRGLVENGYFVYEPDILYGDEGAGIGALDCVNAAMDAVQNNGNINFKRVALLGHSHGGYSTNFIATHSDRFATYISGAGNSDITRSYFSYNRNFHTPFYFQFESGQYEMPPFRENKKMYFNNNPINFVENVNAPILLWAGKKDENIFWEQVQEFYIGLKRNKKDVIALFYTKVGHDLGINTAEKADMHKRVSQWLVYFLKNKKDVDWINEQIKN